MCGSRWRAFAVPFVVLLSKASARTAYGGWLRPARGPRSPPKVALRASSPSGYLPGVGGL